MGLILSCEKLPTSVRVVDQMVFDGLWEKPQGPDLAETLVAPNAAKLKESEKQNRYR